MGRMPADVCKIKRTRGRNQILPDCLLNIKAELGSHGPLQGHLNVLREGRDGRAMNWQEKCLWILSHPGQGCLKENRRSFSSGKQNVAKVWGAGEPRRKSTCLLGKEHLRDMNSLKSRTAGITGSPQLMATIGDRISDQ